jgi:hypothetical protein
MAASTPYASCWAWIRKGFSNSFCSKGETVLFCYTWLYDNGYTLGNNKLETEMVYMYAYPITLHISAAPINKFSAILETFLTKNWRFIPHAYKISLIDAPDSRAQIYAHGIWLWELAHSFNNLLIVQNNNN